MENRTRSRTQSACGGTGTWKTIGDEEFYSPFEDTHDENKSNNRLSASYSTDPLARLRLRMKELRWEDITAPTSSEKYGTTVRKESFDNKPIRRLFLCGGDSSYNIGWVCDSDSDVCMMCTLKWTWLRTRRHCRGCGILVCSSCSPYKAVLTNFPESGGSRVCTNCFGLKSSKIITPLKPTAEKVDGVRRDSNSSKSATVATSTSSISISPCPSKKPHRESLHVAMEASQEEAVSKFEALQQPKYLEAYLIMRRFVPPDIAKSSVKRMVQEGLPEKIAQRLWKCRSLWLICMAKEDICKVHIADFRSKYDWHRLDIVEMRAVYHVVSQQDWDRATAASAKAEWKDGLKVKLDELALKEQKNTLSASETRNSAYAGHEHLVVYDPAVEIEARYNKVTSWETPLAVDSPLPLSSRYQPVMKGSSTSTLHDLKDGSPVARPDLRAATNDESLLERQLEAEIDNWLPLSPMPPQSSSTTAEIETSTVVIRSPLSMPLPRRVSKTSRRGSLCPGTTQMLSPEKSPCVHGRSGIASLEKPNVCRRESIGGVGQCKNIVPFSTAAAFLRAEDLISMPQPKDNDSNVDQPVPVNQPSSALLIAYLLSGEAEKANSIIKMGASIDYARVTTLLLHACEDPDSLEAPLETLKILLQLGAQVNNVDGDGRSPLMALCDNAELGGLLVENGADVLQDDSDGYNPLQTTFESGIEWLLEKFMVCGREDVLLNSSSESDIRKYASILLFGGYGAKVKTILDGRAEPLFNQAEATELLQVCLTNMDNWRDHVETYELFVEHLGVAW